MDAASTEALTDLRQALLEDPGSPVSASLREQPALRARSALCTQQDDVTCRVCFEPEDPEARDVNPLITPCRCRGDSRFIHRQCLQRWRKASLATPGSRAFYRCEVCDSEYRMAPTGTLGVLANPRVFTPLFVLSFVALTWLLGCIPLVQLCFPTRLGCSRSAVLMHLANALYVEGYIGFVAWLLLGHHISMDGSEASRAQMWRTRAAVVHMDGWTMLCVLWAFFALSMLSMLGILSVVPWVALLTAVAMLGFGSAMLALFDAHELLHAKVVAAMPLVEDGSAHACSYCPPACTSVLVVPSSKA